MTSREAERERRQETEANEKRYLLLRGISLTVAVNHVCISEFRVRFICP